ncbi:hypothetical protein BH11PSE12_BH11PSE12_14980 [soil metagenome]
MISSYADLLSAAAQQAQPQRLLFVFAKAGLSHGHDSSQKQQFDNQQGGELTAVMCVDKLTGELSDFASLVAESTHTGKNWDIVFVTTMSGQNGIAPDSNAASRPLDMMIESIKNGNIHNYLAFNKAGELVQFS